MLFATLVLGVLAIWWASGIGRPRADPRAYFTDEEIAQARAYQAPRQIGYAAGAALGVLATAIIAFTPLGDRLLRPVRSWPLPLAAAIGAALVVVAVALVRLPLSYWRGYLHERTWGFATQGALGWVGDWTKSLAIVVVLDALLLGALLALVRALPRAWPLPAAIGAAAVVAALSFLAPVVIEPLFNRFQPLEDRALAGELQSLAARAGVPVREVLVADASRRSRKENAYVSGFGATRRLVVFDTLLERADRDELRLVVAHELGHRRERHVEIETALGGLAAAAAVLIVWLLLRSDAVLRAVRAAGPADPRVVPLVLLAVSALSLVALPPSNWFSRRLETAADRFALELTGEEEAYVRTERNLALRNLSDLDPGPIAYRFLFTHPAPAERISLAPGASGGGK